MKPDRSKANALKSEFYTNTVSEEAINNKVTKKVGLKKKGNLTPAKRAFLNKLEKGMFSEFKNTDWIMYFQQKYKEVNGRGYSLVGEVAWRNERSIYNSLIKKFPPKEIKLMIDFLFDADHDMKPKVQLGAYIMSSKWIDSTYNNALLWRDGLYMTQAQFRNKQYQEAKPAKRNREWIPTETKEEVAVSSDVKVLPKRKKKSVLEF